MNNPDYVSTGEASRILSISRSTISRKVDQGLIAGKVNPITGERQVSVEGLLAFMKEHNVPTDALRIARKEVLVAAAGVVVSAQIELACSLDRRLVASRVEFGSDALMICSRQLPDLLVVSDDLPDIACADVIASLRRQESSRDLKILACVRHADRDAALAWGADEGVFLDAMEAGALCRQAYALLGLKPPGTCDEQAVRHERRWSRIPVQFDGTLGIYRLSHPRRPINGAAQVRNISRGGAFLSPIRVDGGSIPAEPFRMVLQIDQPPLTGWQAHCQVVRLQSNGCMSVGVRFARMSKSDRGKIDELVGLPS